MSLINSAKACMKRGEDYNWDAEEMMRDYCKGTGEKSITPEILKKHSNGDWYWQTLESASSKYFFGDETGDEWNYPRAFLASDGNVFGISYNKMS